jgi:hypothetical protein
VDKGKAQFEDLRRGAETNETLSRIAQIGRAHV